MSDTDYDNVDNDINNLNNLPYDLVDEILMPFLDNDDNDDNDDNNYNNEEPDEKKSCGSIDFDDDYCNSDHSDNNVNKCSFNSCDEFIDAIRYVLETHVNKNNINKNRETIRWFVYFIPELKIEIIMRSYSSNSLLIINEPFEVHACTKPKNKYQTDNFGNIYETKLENIKVNKEWALDCYNFYKEEQKLKTLRYQLFLRAPISKSSDEMAKDFFDEGMICFESHNFKRGRKKFLECLKVLKGNKLDEHYYLSCYNIACCYSRENNKQKALTWLFNSIKNGYTNWAHTITDHDMIPLIEMPYFVKLIKMMMKLSPTRKIYDADVPKELNSVDIFLKKNNLESLEDKNEK